MDEYNPQGFSVEVPKSVIEQPKKEKNIFIQIVIVLVIIGLIILSLPFIICGAFIFPLIPIVVIVILIFAIKGLKKFL